MIKKLLGFSLAVVLSGTGIYIAKDFMAFGKDAYMKSLFTRDDDDEKEEFGGAMGFMALRNANPLTGKIDTGAAYAAYQQAEAHSFNKDGIGSGLLQWTEMGPDNIGGRCRAIIIDKDSNNVVYAAGVTGGLFKSNDAGATWKKVGNNPVLNQNISALCQGADGAIYYGTGENAFLIPNATKASGYSAPGYFGEGIFKSTDHGNTFTQLTSTSPVSATGGLVQNLIASQWMDVSFMAADPTNANRIYAGNDAALEISDDGGTTWKKAATTITGACKDIRITKDGKTIYAVIAGGTFPGDTYHIIRSLDQGSTWTEVGTNKNGVQSSASSMMLAIAPSNEKTIYASVSNNGNTFQGIYRSDDQGTTWSTFVSGGSGQGAFNPFNSQGFYDNSIAVDPLNYNKVYLGGLDLWSFDNQSGSVQTTQLSSSSSYTAQSNQGVPNYVHADQHIIIFDRAQPYPNAYFGCDGGVFKSSDVSNPNVVTKTFGNADYGFNTTQFYGIGVGADYPTHVIAGAQDNGEVNVRSSGLTLLDGAAIDGGDAGYSEISKLNPKMYIEEYTDGNISRSFNQGGPPPKGDWDAFMTATGEMITPPGPSYSFISWFSMWESANDPTSIDSVVYNDPKYAHKAGTTIQVESPNGVTFPYVLKNDLAAKQNITVQDITQCKMFVVDNGEIWMTKDILNISLTAPVFYKIANIPGFLPLMVRSTVDGNTLFAAGTLNGGAALYRITGLSGKVYKYKTAALSSFSPDSIGIVKTLLYTSPGQTGTGVAIDDNDPNHILFCTGTYDRTNSHVFESDNAMAVSPTFTAITSNSNGFPSLPVYDVLIDSHNPNIYLAGTDNGVYSSKDKGNTWMEENAGMERVPVAMLRQQKYLDKSWDGPYIYCATFGRGVFYSGSLTTGIDEQGGAGKVADRLKMDIYPNPVHGSVNVNVDLSSPAQVNVYIYDIQGKLLSAHNYNSQASGNHIYNIATTDLKEGTYFVKVSAGGLEQTSKMLVLN